MRNTLGMFVYSVLQKKRHVSSSKFCFISALVLICSLTQAQPVTFKVDMGYICETSERGAKFTGQIYGGNGQYFQQVFSNNDRSVESMVAVNVGKWKVKNINENGDQVLYEDIYRLDIRRKQWNVEEVDKDRKFYEYLAKSKSKSNLFYVVNESKNAAEVVCQESPQYSAKLLELADEYKKRAENTAEQYRESQRKLTSVTRAQTVGQLVEADRAVKQLEQNSSGGSCNAKAVGLRSMINNIANQLSEYDKTVNKMYSVSQQNGEMFVRKNNMYGYFFKNTTSILEESRKAIGECRSGRLQ